MRRLLPDPGPTSVEQQLDGLELASRAHDDRPYVITNFAVTLDGRATIQGRSGAIGSDTDTQMLVGLRTKVDAVLIGAGTLRAERYGRVVPDPDQRARREGDGLSQDPLAVVVSGRLDVPWDAGLFTDGAGEVLIFTASETEAPKTRTPVTVVRHEDRVELAAALNHLRTERGVRTLLCEGGPILHAQLIEAGLVDELFVTHAPKLAGGEGPGLVTGLPALERPLELAWLLEHDGELFGRYRTVRPPE
ncbi:MAG TPA: dihydrofolate reductase family protein [Solirubrobacterales bacterium]|nr:dihydrofolate reductase family protein [Solirubrobacterales bacterium]